MRVPLAGNRCLLGTFKPTEKSEPIDDDDG